MTNTKYETQRENLIKRFLLSKKYNQSQLKLRHINYKDNNAIMCNGRVLYIEKNVWKKDGLFSVESNQYVDNLTYNDTSKLIPTEFVPIESVTLRFALKYGRRLTTAKLTYYYQVNGFIYQQSLVEEAIKLLKHRQLNGIEALHYGYFQLSKGGLLYLNDDYQTMVIVPNRDYNLIPAFTPKKG